MFQLPEGFDGQSSDVRVARYFAARQVGSDVARARAEALLTRAWTPFGRYRARGVMEELDLGGDSCMVEACFVAAVVEAVEEDADDRPLLPIPGRSSRRASLDPGGRHGAAQVGELAVALAACLPALYLALLDGTVPEAVGSGEPYESRAALADLYVAYAASDPGHAGENFDLVWRVLNTPPAANAPIEVTDRWDWFVYVCGGDSIMPFRCFRNLSDAKNYALLQTDFTRSRGRLRRGDDRFQTAVSAIDSCPADGIVVEVAGQECVTVMKPVDRRRLPVRLASASWWLPAPLG